MKESDSHLSNEQAAAPEDSGDPAEQVPALSWDRVRFYNFIGCFKEAP